MEPELTNNNVALLPSPQDLFSQSQNHYLQKGYTLEEFYTLFNKNAGAPIALERILEIHEDLAQGYQVPEVNIRQAILSPDAQEVSQIERLIPLALLHKKLIDIGCNREDSQTLVACLIPHHRPKEITRLINTAIRAQCPLEQIKNALKTNDGFSALTALVEHRTPIIVDLTHSTCAANTGQPVLSRNVASGSALAAAVNRSPADPALPPLPSVNTASTPVNRHCSFINASQFNNRSMHTTAQAHQATFSQTTCPISASQLSSVTNPNHTEFYSPASVATTYHISQTFTVSATKTQSYTTPTTARHFPPNVGHSHILTATSPSQPVPGRLNFDCDSIELVSCSNH